MLASLVIPIHNEAKNIPQLLQQLRAAIAATQDWLFEIIFVDDGSHDHSCALLREQQHSFPQIVILRLSKNFGHQAAMLAGMMQAQGDVVITLDGDCQHPPMEIPRMLAAYENGAEVVQMVRANKSAGIKGLLSRWFYRIFSRLANTEIVANGADFRLLSRRILTVLNSIPEKDKFLRALLPTLGFQQVQLYYQEQPRFAGIASYTLARSAQLARKAIFDFSTFPLRLVFYTGLLLASLSIAWGIYHVLAKLLNTHAALPGYTDIIASILFLSGCILGAIGIIGRYLQMVLEQLRGRPSYVIASIERTTAQVIAQVGGEHLQEPAVMRQD